MTTAAIPTRIDQHSPTEMLVAWNSGEQYALSFVELRYHCPCANCVDEHTGRRTIQRTSISPEIRPTGAQVIGKYALQVSWTDRHSTGMYHFDRLLELCQKQGRPL
jgi:DUF971 family protein